MASIEPLKFIKRWFTGSFTKEADFDELANRTGEYATRTNSHLKQIGLDLGGASYDFNGQGRATQSTSVIARLDSLETFTAVGTSNLGISVADTTTPILTAADGTTLSATNVGTVVINRTANPGQILSRQMTAPQSVSLTGAHWGFDGDGDLTDFKLWLVLIDTGSACIFGVTAEGGKATATTSDCKTIPTNVTSRSHVLTASAVAAEGAVIYFGWMHVAFDDTGGASENLWTIQTGAGDIHIMTAPPYLEVSELRF